MRQANLAYPAVSDEGRTQTDDEPSDVTRILTLRRSGTDASRSHL
jgi:hypothetical protein